MIQQLAAAPHKGQALLILAGTGALAHKHNLGGGHALPEHNVRAGTAQAAAAAVQAFLTQIFQFHTMHLYG